MKRSAISLLSLFLWVLPASPNYKLFDYGFGSGGGANQSSSNYSLYGISGQVGSLNLTANVPDAPTLSNPSEFYNKLNITIDTAGNPADTKYAIAISDDDFVTTKYIKSDYFMGTTLVLADYLTYSQWGSGSGTTIYGLKTSTTYKAKVKAFAGKFSE